MLLVANYPVHLSVLPQATAGNYTCINAFFVYNENFSWVAHIFGEILSQGGDSPVTDDTAHNYFSYPSFPGWRWTMHFHFPFLPAYCLSWNLRFWQTFEKTKWVSTLLKIPRPKYSAMTEKPSCEHWSWRRNCSCKSLLCSCERIISITFLQPHKKQMYHIRKDFIK